MKKLIVCLVAAMMFCSAAKAEAIVVIDQNGNVIRQMYTSPSTFDTKPNTVVTSVPMQTISVVRESPVIQNSYYYDSNATNAALAAGVTTAVVGGLLYHGFHGGYHHRHRHHHRHRWW